MKLETTLPERPGLLHALPVVNLLAVLWLVSVLVPAMVQSPGVAVELPPSSFQLERYRNHLVVTIRAGDAGPVVYLGRDVVSLEELSGRLDDYARADGVGRTMVLLRTDGSVDVGTERRISELILGKEFRLAIAGGNRKDKRAQFQPGTD